MAWIFLCLALTRAEVHHVGARVGARIFKVMGYTDVV